MKRLSVPFSYPAPVAVDGVTQPACQGGSVAVESVAAFPWNGWQASSGISGNLGLEYAPWGEYRRGFEGTVTLTRADFGIDYDLGEEAEEVEMYLSVEGIRQD